MKTITLYDKWNDARTFELVDKIPSGFFVWNIGENMGSDKHIPICESLVPEDKENFSINPETLKAIELDPEEVLLLRKGATVGINSLSSCKEHLNNAGDGYYDKRKKDSATECLAIFERITE